MMELEKKVEEPIEDYMTIDFYETDETKEDYIIVDFYETDEIKDRSPISLIMDLSDVKPGELEIEDEIKMGYLWKKYSKNE